MIKVKILHHLRSFFFFVWLFWCTFQHGAAARITAGGQVCPPRLVGSCATARMPIGSRVRHWVARSNPLERTQPSSQRFGVKGLGNVAWSRLNMCHPHRGSMDAWQAQAMAERFETRCETKRPQMECDGVRSRPFGDSSRCELSEKPQCEGQFSIFFLPLSSQLPWSCMAAPLDSTASFWSTCYAGALSQPQWWMWVGILGCLK